MFKVEPRVKFHGFTADVAADTVAVDDRWLLLVLSLCVPTIRTSGSSTLILLLAFFVEHNVALRIPKTNCRVGTRRYEIHQEPGFGGHLDVVGSSRRATVCTCRL